MKEWMVRVLIGLIRRIGVSVWPAQEIEETQAEVVALREKVARLEMEANGLKEECLRAETGELRVTKKVNELQKQLEKGLVRIEGSVLAAAERKGKFDEKVRREMAKGMGQHPVVQAILDEVQVVWWEYCTVATNPESSERRMHGAHGAMDAVGLLKWRVEQLTRDEETK